MWLPLDLIWPLDQNVFIILEVRGQVYHEKRVSAGLFVTGRSFNGQGKVENERIFYGGFCRKMWRQYRDSEKNEIRFELKAIRANCAERTKSDSAGW